MKNKYKGLLVIENIIYRDIAEDILVEPIHEKWEKLGTPIFNRAGEYYLRDGTHWFEDGKGMAIFYLRKDKGMRNLLVNLHLASKRPLTDTEYLAAKKIIKAKLPGNKKLKEFFYYYDENLYLNNIRKGYNSYHSKMKRGKL